MYSPITHPEPFPVSPGDASAMFAVGSGGVYIDDLTVATPSASGWTTDVVESFDQTGGYGLEQPTHDAAGNLTYDGLYQYTYDAWNHLVNTSRAYRDASGDVQIGQTVTTAQYDGLGRRIVKRVQNSADLDCTYHYYYDGQSAVEVRDGSDLTIKQHVWGNLAGGYIDELVQTSINEDPLTDDVCETDYYAATGPNYNVLGLFDASGTIVERYEYTPYGQRQVYTSAGPNDPKAYAPLMMSKRVEDVYGNPQPYGLNTIGHQGLIHDEATRLVYNRTRMLSPRLGRFLQRDPMGYVDGMGFHEYINSNPLSSTDFFGLVSDKNAERIVRKFLESKGSSHRYKCKGGAITDNKQIAERIFWMANRGWTTDYVWNVGVGTAFAPLKALPAGFWGKLSIDGLETVVNASRSGGMGESDIIDTIKKAGTKLTPDEIGVVEDVATNLVKQLAGSYGGKARLVTKQWHNARLCRISPFQHAMACLALG